MGQGNMNKLKILKYILFSFYNVEETKVVNNSGLTAHPTLTKIKKTGILQICLY